MFRGFGEIHPGRVGYAVGARAEINDVEVFGEDLRFAELALELAGQGGLLELANQGAVLAQKYGAGQLLGDRAGPLLHRALAQVAHHGPADPHRVNAVVLIEAPVFRGDKSLLHQGRHRFGRQLFASYRPDFVHHLAIGREDGEGAWAVEVVDATGVGQQAVKARH